MKEIELLTAFLPESDFGKIIGLLLVGFIVLVWSGKIKLEWLGTAAMKLWRKFMCRRGDHETVVAYDHEGEKIVGLVCIHCDAYFPGHRIEKIV